MKIIFAVITAFLLGCSLYCCSTTNGEAAAPGEINYDSLGPVVAAYLPAREGDSVIGWGMVRADGSMLFSNKFSQRPSAVVNGYFTVREGQGVTVYRASANPVAVDGLKDLAYAGAMSHGLMPITRKGRRIEIVDGEGQTRIALTSIDGKEIVKTGAYFIDGVLPVYTQDGHWGAINTQGEMVVDAIYDAQPQFSEGIAAVHRSAVETVDSVETTVTRHYLINNRGKVVYTFPKNMTPQGVYRAGRIAVRLPDGAMGFLASDGTVTRLQPSVKTVTDYNKEYTVWADRSDLFGLDDFSGRTLITPRFKSIVLAPGNRLLVATDGGYAITDSVGSPKIRLSGFDKVTDLQWIAPGVITPFCYLGKGFAGDVMLDRQGHRLGAGPFAAISTDVTLLADGCVYTDFFNVQTAVHSIAGRLSENGWGGIELGRQMSTLTDSLEAATNETMSLRIGREKEYMLDLDVIAYSNSPVIRDSISEEGVRLKLPNTHSRVVYLRVEATLPVARYPEMLHNLGSEIVPRGFRAEKIRDEYAVYARENTYVIVTPRPGLQGLYFYVMNKAFYDEASPRIIADGEKLYRQATEPQTPAKR